MSPKFNDSIPIQQLKILYLKTLLHANIKYTYALGHVTCCKKLEGPELWNIVNGYGPENKCKWCAHN